MGISMASFLLTTGDFIREPLISQVWQQVPLIQATERQKQEDLFEFKTSLVYTTVSA